MGTVDGRIGRDLVTFSSSFVQQRVLAFCRLLPCVLEMLLHSDFGSLCSLVHHNLLSKDQNSPVTGILEALPLSKRDSGRPPLSKAPIFHWTFEFLLEEEPG